MSLIEKIAEAIVPIIKDRRTVRRYFGRRSIDKSCGEVVFDADPDGPISDETFKVVERIDARNFDGEKLASERAAILADRYSAERAAQAALTVIMGEGDGVQQCDREAAKDWLTANEYVPTLPELLSLSLAFARHRSTAAAAERARIVAGVRACELSSAIPDDPAQIIRDLADAIERGEV